MRDRLIGVAVFSAVLLTGASQWGEVQAASFDCTKAFYNAERLICSVPSLSQMDDKLAAEYANARGQSTNPQQLASDERAWVAKRNQCQTVACVTEAYNQRLAQLEGQTRTIAPSQGVAPNQSATPNQGGSPSQNQAASDEEISKLSITDSELSGVIVLEVPNERQHLSTLRTWLEGVYNNPQVEKISAGRVLIDSIQPYLAIYIKVKGHTTIGVVLYQFEDELFARFLVLDGETHKIETSSDQMAAVLLLMGLPKRK